MNASQIRRIDRRNAAVAANAPRPFNLGTVFTTTGETSLCSIYSRGMIIALVEADEYGPRCEVRMHDGRTGILHRSVMEAV